ncbi:amino acid adenylation domain-containing protein [Micromonosporaceae bacterium B7E4]
MTDLRAKLCTLTPAQRALLVERLGQGTSGVPGPAEPVAVVGIGCRLPGVEGPDEFWQALLAGRDLVTEVPKDRWDSDEWYDPEPLTPGAISSRCGAFVDDVTGFDRRYFGIPVDEARWMDPQQRMILEIAHAALDDAGIPYPTLAGSGTGVFVASITDDYAWLQAGLVERTSAHTGTGLQRSIMANRLSWELDLRGPSVSVDTACSSSLTAVHLACQSLRTGESDLALAGGVNVMVDPASSVIYAKLGVLSPDGRCRTFDAGANGIVRGEGCAMVVLKRMADATRDGDAVWAVIRGSAVGQDGRTSSLTAPSGPAQQAVVRRALADAGVRPAEVGLVETHGTGTVLGDPQEVEALARVLDGPDRGPCLLGALKTNTGHLEAAAGVTGLVKAALSLRYRTVPPVLHLRELNPRLNLSDTPFQIPTSVTDWPGDAPPYAGVSSFGFGGALAHVVLAAAPDTGDRGRSGVRGREPAGAVEPGTDRAEPPGLLVCSARAPEALAELSGRYADLLERAAAPLRDVVYSAACRRTHHPYRRAVVVTDPAQAAAALRTVPARAPVPAPGGAEPAVAFLFPGQGAVVPGLGSELYETEPAYRRAFDECDRVLAEASGWSVAEALAGGRDVTPTRVAQPALFAFQVALAALWESWGVRPGVAVGQSLGEVAAAYVAGALKLSDAARIVVERARVMSTMEGAGATAVTELPVVEARQLARRHGLAVAGVLGPTTTVVCGPADAVGSLVGDLVDAGTFARQLPGVRLAFHGPEMATLAPELTRALDGLRPRACRLPLLSTVTGLPVDGPELDATYWGFNLGHPFQLPPAVEDVAGRGVTCWLELSPHPALGRAVTGTAPGATVLGSLARGEPERHALLNTLGELYTRGVAVDWPAVTALGRVVRLPGYPWQRESVWLPDLPVRRRFGDRRQPPGAPSPNGSGRPAAVGRDGGRDWPAPAPAAVTGVPATQVAGPADAETGDPLSDRLRRMWAEALDLELAAVTPDANFFALGGDSLAAFALVRKISEQLGVRIPFADLTDLLTIHQLTDYLRESAGSASEPPTRRPEQPEQRDPAVQSTQPVQAEQSTKPAQAEQGANPEQSTQPAQAAGDRVGSADDAVPVDADRYEPFPLMPIQQAYWVGRAEGLDLGGVSAHYYLEYDSTDLDLPRLEAAWNRMVRRHEMLRAVVDPDGRQRILPQVPHYRIEVADVGDGDEAAFAEAAERTRAELSHEVRPAGEWPLFSLRATRSGKRVRLHLGMDMLVFDGRSFEILSTEWQRGYQDPTCALEPLTLSFRTFVQQWAAADVSADLAYWEPRLDTLPPPPDLPLAADPAAVGTPRFRRRSARLEPDSWARLTARAAEHGLSSSALVLACYAEVLATWSRTDEFTVNVTTFNLRSLHPAAETVVGDFTSTVPVAVATAEPEFCGRARQVQRQLWSDLAHLRVSGVDLVARAAQRRADDAFGLGVPYVFTSLLAGGRGTAAPPRPVPLSWLGDRAFGVSQTPQVLVDLQVMEDAGGLHIDLDVVEEMFPAGLPNDLFGALCGLLHRLADDPSQWRSAPRTLVPEAQLAVRRAVNATDAPIPRGPLHGPFLRQARATPARTAVVAPDRILSYGELDAASEAVAELLAGRGVRRGDLVAVSLRKGWRQVVAVLGVLKSGAGYVPVDPDQPAERRRQLVTRVSARFVLTGPDLAGTLDLPDEASEVVVDPGAGAPVRERPDPHPDDLAYVIFTSGSTGTPKGVAISHRAALNTVLDINHRFAVGPDDAVLGLSALNFDLSVYDVFGVLGAGARLVLPDPADLLDPARWAELVSRAGVTLWNTVPALLSLYVGQLEATGGTCPTLRLALLSGDWIPLDLPDRFRAVAPEARVVSLGGATEASIWSICHPIGEVDPDWRSVPYGRPLSNQRWYVLDSELRDRPDWAPGDLYIGGVGVAEGYYGDPERTRASFVVHPRTGERLYRTGDLGRYLPDGVLEFLGREDLQVKIQGYRIELEEIEAALSREPRVRAAAVVAVGPRDGTRRLVAHLAQAAGTPPESAEIRAYLAERLPGYMVPAGIVWHDRLPLTRNGKVDRTRLLEDSDPADPTAGTGSAPGADADLLRTVAELVAELVGGGPVRPTARLADVGAASADVMRLAERLQRRFGCRPAMRDLFARYTVADIAAFYAPAAPGPAESTPPPPVDPTGAGPAVHGVGPAPNGAAPTPDRTVPNGAVPVPGPTAPNGAVPVADRTAPNGAAAGPVRAAVNGAGGDAVERAGSTGSVAVPVGGQCPDLEVILDPDERKRFRAARPALRRFAADQQRVRLTRTDPVSRRGTGRAGFATGPLPLDAFSALLGRLGEETGEDGQARRGYGSAGGLYPVQVYVHVAPGRVDGLAEGLYYLDPLDRTLVRLATVDGPLDGVHLPDNRRVVGHAAATLVLVGRMGAIVPLYGERSRDFVLIEAGAIAQELERSAADLGLSVRQIGDGDFDAIRSRCRLDETDELVHVLVVGKPRSEAPEASAASGKVASPGPAAVAAVDGVSTDPAGTKPFALSPVQEALWVGRAGEYELGGVSTHTYVEFEVDSVQPERLEGAWREVIARHPMLRAVVTPDARQQVLATVPPYEVEVVDLRGAGPDRVRDEVAGTRRELSHRVTRTDRWPLVHTRLLRCDGADRLVLSVDSQLLDAYSVLLVLGDLARAYDRPGSLPPPPGVTFREYLATEAAEQERGGRERAAGYWRDRLPTLPPGPRLPARRDPAVLAEPRFRRWEWELPPERWRRFGELVAEHGLTASAVLGTAFALVLRDWSVEPRFTLNLTLFDRRPVHPDVNELVGQLNRTTLLPVDLAGALPFDEYARQVQEQLWESLEHRDHSGVQVLREVSARLGGGAAAVMPVVFTSMLNLPYGPVHAAWRDWLGEPVAFVTQTPQVWLEHGVMVRRDTVHLYWDAVEDLLTPETLDEMFTAYRRLVERLCDDPESWRRPPPVAVERPAPAPTTADPAVRLGRACGVTGDDRVLVLAAPDHPAAGRLPAPPADGGPASVVLTTGRDWDAGPRPEAADARLVVCQTRHPRDLTRRIRQSAPRARVVAALAVGDDPWAVLCEVVDDRAYALPSTVAVGQVRDEQGRPRPNRVPGRLTVGGVDTGLLARWCDGDRIELLGPADEQPRVGGWPVDAWEVVAALVEHPAVADAVVLTRDGCLVGYYTGVPGADRVPAATAEPAALRDHLGRRLPAHRVPAVLVPVPALPEDLALLPDPPDRPPAGAGSADPGESPTGFAEHAERVSELLRQVLDRASVGPDDNLFDLGATSVHLIRLRQLLRAELGTDLPVVEMFEYPTVRALARRLADSARRPPATADGAAPAAPTPSTGVVARAVDRANRRRTATAWLTSGEVPDEQGR